MMHGVARSKFNKIERIHMGMTDHFNRVHSFTRRRTHQLIFNPALKSAGVKGVSLHTSTTSSGKGGKASGFRHRVELHGLGSRS